MVEHALQAAFRAGLTEAEFWKSTPYLTGLRVSASLRGAAEGSITTAWHTVAFDRTRVLHPLAEILAAKQPDEQREADISEVRDWAHRWGLKPDLRPTE